MTSSVSVVTLTGFLFQWNSAELSCVFLSVSVEAWGEVWQLTNLQGEEFPLLHLNLMPLIILTVTSSK